jgi:hypothetical protein
MRLPPRSSGSATSKTEFRHHYRRFVFDFPGNRHAGMVNEEAFAPNDKRLKPTRVNDIRGRLQPLRHAELGTRRRSIRLKRRICSFCRTRSGF